MKTNGIDPKTIEFRNNILDRLPELKNTGECAVPNTQQFWDYYKSHKQAFYEACLQLFRTTEGKWRIRAYDLRDHETRRKEQIEEMKTKHNLFCEPCKQSVGICRSVMKDGREMYQGYCPACFKIMTTALPHALVEYYVEGSLIIVDRDTLGEKSDAN